MDMQFDSIDKRTEAFTIKIPEILKVRLDKVGEIERKRMVWEILQLMAKYAHNADFNPFDYLRSE